MVKIDFEIEWKHLHPQKSLKLQKRSDAWDKSNWDWTMMIMTPDWIQKAHIDQALEEVKAKKAYPTSPPGLKIIQCPSRVRKAAGQISSPKIK